MDVREIEGEEKMTVILRVENLVFTLFHFITNELLIKCRKM